MPNLNRPPALEAVMEQERGGGPERDFPEFSEEWYWQQLVASKHFCSVYADTPGAQQPLITGNNLSQTPREQCELEGIVTEGLQWAGPGQEVELHGLRSCPELNGKRGRQLPGTGPGAPKTAWTPGRIPVRLADGRREVAVRLANMRSPHAPAPAAGPSAARPRGEQQQQQQQQLARAPAQQQRKAEVLRLLEGEFRLWRTGACLTPATLRRGGMQEPHIRCCVCETRGDAAERYVALKRAALLSAAPLPGSALRLACLGCYAEGVLRAGVPLTEDSIQAFCESYMMGAMEACMQLSGMPRVQWGGEHGSGALY